MKNARTLAKAVDDAFLAALRPFEQFLKALIRAVGMKAFELGPRVRVLPDDGGGPICALGAVICVPGAQDCVFIVVPVIEFGRVAKGLEPPGRGCGGRL